MPTDAPSQHPLPDDLQARLDAAGVTDDASLAAALERDPALAADLQAFVEANAEALAGDGMAALQTLAHHLRTPAARKQFVPQPVFFQPKKAAIAAGLIKDFKLIVHE